jgi:hypothetical protein
MKKIVNGKVHIMTRGMELLLQEFLLHKFDTRDQANEPERCVKALLFNTEV